MRTIRSFAAALIALLAPAAPAFAQGFSIALGPNPSCGGTMRPITALEAFEHQDAICKRLGLDEQWGIWGIGGGGAMGGQGYGCNIFKKWPQGPINGPTICTARTAPGARTFAAQTLSFGAESDLAARFAPVLKFDRAGARYGLPMSAQPFFNALKKENGIPVSMPGKAPLGIENTDSATLANGSIPTYYQVRTFGNQVRIRYWWFYGYQHACWRDEGEHNGDWENIIVILTEDRNAIAAVVYYQHGGWYTRIAGPRDAPCTPGGSGRCGGSHGFPTEGKRPVVYVGKISHGSFHDDNASGPGALQAPNPGEGNLTNCSYYGDYRNPGSPADWLHTQRNLVDLDLYGEPWMLVDNILPNGRQAEWIWGPKGVSKHPKQNPPPQDLAACEGSSRWDTGLIAGNVGCYKSECYAGDDQASEHCLKECKPDYTNHGLTCWKSAFHLYGRLQGDHWYRYDYRLPTSDVGLLRRRRAINDDESEWDVP